MLLTRILKKLALNPSTLADAKTVQNKGFASVNQFIENVPLIHTVLVISSSYCILSAEKKINYQAHAVQC